MLAVNVLFSGIRIAPSVMNKGDQAVKRAIMQIIGLSSDDARSVEVTRRSIDARKKADIAYVVSAVADVDDRIAKAYLKNDHDPSAGNRPSRSHSNGNGSSLPLPSGVSARPFEQPTPLNIPDLSSGRLDEAQRPLIVGAGPAGLFCALYLARAGLKPMLIERGEAVSARERTIARFIETGELDPNSNIQFGEGGAGTFSDGKLTTGTKSPFARFILEEFVSAGAPESILVDAKPHVGTDYLGIVVSTLRQRIEEAGGIVRFNTLLEGIDIDIDPRGGRVIKGALLRDLAKDEPYCFPTDRIVLALGHSARDTYEMLKGHAVMLERKPFAIGARIEHPQALIDQAQYGNAASLLPPADYKLAMHTSEGRGVYTFCMCPGGEVVASASEEGGVCVNGMSRYARDGRQANSALLVEVHPSDLAGEDVLAGMYLQRDLEQRAYEMAQQAGAYAAPISRVGDFLAPSSRIGEAASLDVRPTYPRGVRSVSFDELFPSFVIDAMREALPLFDRRLRGFAHPDAVMTAPEARSSAPVRIIRDPQSLCSANTQGLYPTGEGAGYAGGIMSAAADGLKVASRIVDGLCEAKEDA